MLYQKTLTDTKKFTEELLNNEHKSVLFGYMLIISNNGEKRKRK